MSQSQTTILIVEDEEPLADLYGEWLRNQYEFRTAYDGEEALELIDENVDLVVLDRRMPGKSGDEVLEEFRNRGYDCKIIMTTAVDPDLNILAMDFDDYLCKPIDRDTFLEAINHHITPASRNVSLIDEFFSSVSKIIVLRNSLSNVELNESDEYEELQHRVEVLHSELSETVEDFDEMVSSYREIHRS